MQRTTTTERAAATPSPVLAYATWLIAQGLSVLVRPNAAAYDKARQLNRMAAERVDWDAMVKLGLSKKLFTASDESGTWIRSAINVLKADIKTKVSQNPNIPDEELKVLKAATIWVGAPDKPGAVDRIRKVSAAISGKLYRNVERVLDSTGGATTTTETETDAPPPASLQATSIGSLVSEYTALAKRIAPGAADANITPTETKAYAAQGTSQTGEVREYNRTKRVLGERYLMDLAKFTATQSGPVLVHEAFAHMNRLGYPFAKIIAAKREIPLRVDVVGGKIKYFTQDGEPLLGAIPANINKIGFPKTYDPETKQGAYMVIKAPTAVGVTRIYTEAHKTAAQADKFGKAESISENINTYLARWVRDLNNADPFVQMAAAICYIIYATGARIGSRQFSAASNSGEQTYGIISLRPRHVRVTASSITFEYVGKKNGAQKHVIKITDVVTRRLAQLLTQLKAGKKKDDLLFSVPAPNGKLQHIIPKRVTDYLHSMGYQGGAHKMRHVRGTNLVVELLQKTPWKATKTATTLQARQREAEDWMKSKVLEPVGKLLGHFSGDKVTWRTSIANYINPNVVAEWFIKNGLKVPSWVPKTIAADD